MSCKNYVFTGHAVSQMYKRRISKDEVRHVLENAEIIKEYPDDNPYPSKLALGYFKERPIHVVFSFNIENETCYIITAYSPAPELWDENFKYKR